MVTVILVSLIPSNWIVVGLNEQVNPFGLSGKEYDNPAVVAYPRLEWNDIEKVVEMIKNHLKLPQAPKGDVCGAKHKNIIS